MHWEAAYGIWQRKNHPDDRGRMGKKSKELNAKYGTVFYNFITKDGKEYVTASFNEDDKKE